MLRSPSHWHLLWQLVRRDLAGRYRGSLLGIVWMIATPLLMLLIYSFVFGVVFQAKWGVNVDGYDIPFPILLFSGLILHGFLAEVLQRSVTLIRSHPNYVKKVVFPVQLLPVMVTVGALSLLLIQFGLLTIAATYYGLLPGVYWLWLPALLMPYVLMALGLAWLLAALGVFIPDLQHVVGLAVTVLLFLSPVFYSIDMLPALWQPVLFFNPLTPLIENIRLVLFYHQHPGLHSLIGLWTTGLAMFIIGRWFFNRTKAAFSDVL